MKATISIVCLTLCLVALVAGASAQATLNFSNLPLINTPSPMPNGYGQLDWGNFFYVDPYGWSGAGPGYRLGPRTGDVAFVGGRFCRLDGHACYGTVTNARGFVLVSADIAAGFGPTAVTVTAYKNGAYLGTANYFLTTEMRTVNFPSSWGAATEVVFQVTGDSDGMVLYSLSLYTLGG